MTAAPTEYDELLRNAIEQVKSKAGQADDDLIRFASKAANAVRAVTGGAASLELLPLKSVEGHAEIPKYQMQLRRTGSVAPPSDLGVYAVAAAG